MNLFVTLGAEHFFEGTMPVPVSGFGTELRAKEAEHNGLFLGDNRLVHLRIDAIEDIRPELIVFRGLTTGHGTHEMVFLAESQDIDDCTIDDWTIDDWTID